MNLPQGWLIIVLLFSVPAALAAEAPRLSVALPELSGTSGRTISVGPEDSLQQALDRAGPGDTIELQAGARYQGPFILRKHSGPDWITIVSVGARQGALPAAGTRVTPQDMSAMATLTATRDAVISTDAGAGRYHFIGIHIKPDNLHAVTTLVNLSSGNNSIESMPHHIVFERSYLQGDPVLATRRGITMNGAHIAVIDSHLAGFKSVEDAQALVSWEGTGPFLIRNNYLEATGENVMFGGADPGIKGRVPSDITIVGNHFSKPLYWQRTHASYDGSSWSVKNILELKNAQRVQIEGNLFEHNWPQAQNGFAILFTVRNQDGKSPWSRVRDVRFSNNIVRHVAAAISILGQDDIHASQQTQNLTISNNLFYDIGNDWGSGRLFQILNSPAQISISHNTAMQSDAIMWLEGEPIVGASIVGNIFSHNRYGFIGTDTAPGLGTLNAYLAAPVEMQGNLLIECGQTRYPRGLSCIRNSGAVGFTDIENDDLRLFSTRHGPVNGGQAAPGVDFNMLCNALSVTERPAYCQ